MSFSTAHADAKWNFTSIDGQNARSAEVFHSTEGNAWTDKLSNDLLQLIDPETRSPGQTSHEIADEMEMLSQLRYDENNISEVKVLIVLEESAHADLIIPLVNETAVDPVYGMISGWIHTSLLDDVANRTEVKQIRTQILPVESNTLIAGKTPGILQPGNGSTPKDTPVLQAKSVDQSSLEEKGEEQPGLPAWKEKLSTDLLQLIDDGYLSPGQSRRDLQNLMETTGELRPGAGNESEVMVSAHVSSGLQLPFILEYFSNGRSDSAYGKIAGWIPVHNLSALAREPGIISIMAQIPPVTSRIRTEGDTLLHTDEFRNITNLTGKGIKVGIISDGVSSLEAVVAEGELPDTVQIVDDNIGGDEGTAMLQIVHDIAPEAELYFHDRGSSQIEFVQAMDALINRGCRIICDDITYVEPFFEDGYIARNIRDRILSYGILYVTSAGNFAQEHYQAPFNGYMDGGYLWQDFKGTGGSKELKFTAPPHSAGHIILQWDDPFSESSNNYDLFIYNSELREIGRSVKIQDGDDDPMEYCRFVNEEKTVKNFYLRVVQAGGENRTIEIYVLPMGGNPVTLDPCIPEDSMFGQQAVFEALSVGAVAPGNNFTTIEPYSSRGPVTIQFPVPELREKPELSAPDGVTITTGSGVSASFSGTSASAPHIAGLASLIWSSDSLLKENDIRKFLINATSSGNLTWHPATGYGVPDARILIPDLHTVSQKRPDSINEVNYLGIFTPRETEPADTIVFYPGWNMISIPFPLKSGSDTGRIFSGINTSGHTIWHYKGEGNDWIPVHPEDNLTQMDVVWIYSDSRTVLSLTYDDSRTNMTACHLEAGWNPLGIPGRSSLTACELFNPLKNEWIFILVFDPRLQQYRPAIINGGSGTYSDERLLYPTEGFWVYMKEPGILIP